MLVEICDQYLSYRTRRTAELNLLELNQRFGVVIAWILSRTCDATTEYELA